MKQNLIAALFMLCIVAMSHVILNAQGEKMMSPTGVELFSKLTGKWDADAKLTIDGKTYPIKYSVTGKLTADGNGLYADESFSNPELGTLIGVNLAGYNPYDKMIHWFSVDNMGTAHEHIGSWKSSHLFTMEHTGLQNGKKYVETVSMDFTDDKTMNFTLIATLDGKETERGSGVFHRQ